MIIHIKGCFIFFNTLFLGSGIALVIIGAMSRTTYLEMATFTGVALSRTAILLVVVGIFIAVISFLGCFGACTNSSPLLASFTGILIVIVSVEIVAGIALYILRIKVNDTINKKAQSVIDKYSMKDRATIDDIQDEFDCCGADGYTDWFSSQGWATPTAVPDSCCVVEREGCGQVISSTNIYQRGCTWALKLYLLKHLVVVAAACVGLGIVEVFGVLLGVCLFIDLKRQSHEDIK